MKKTGLMLAAIMTLAGLTATAQKSSKYLIGSVAYSKSTGADATYSLNPQVGYYLTDKTSAGVLGTVGESATATVTNIGAFVRNDFMKVGKNCDIFAQLSVGSNTTKTSGTKVSEFATTLGLGANYFINKKWSLTMNLTDIASYKSGDGSSTFSFGFGNIVNPFSNANIGLVYKF